MGGDGVFFNLKLQSVWQCYSRDCESEDTLYKAVGGNHQSLEGRVGVSFVDFSFVGQIYIFNMISGWYFFDAGTKRLLCTQLTQVAVVN